MRKLLITLLLSISITVFSQKGNSSELVEQGLKRIPFKSGKITYSISGDAEGSAEYAFNQWGWLESNSRNMTYKLFGMSNTEERLQVRDGDFLFVINLKTNTGSKSKDTQLSDLMKYKSPTESLYAIYSSFGGSLTRTDTLLGKKVNVWEFPSGNTMELWDWEGITLKSLRKLSKVTYTLTATEIEFSSDYVVKIPENIDWGN